MTDKSQYGRWGENLACELLIAKGYSIVGRNIKVAGVEVDIMAMHGNRIAVVEVKTRRHPDEDPTFGIDRRKVMRLARAGAAYVKSNSLPHEVQIDLVFITGSPDDSYTIEHRPDAFMPPRRSIR